MSEHSRSNYLAESISGIPSPIQREKGRHDNQGGKNGCTAIEKWWIAAPGFDSFLLINPTLPLDITQSSDHGSVAPSSPPRIVCSDWTELKRKTHNWFNGSNSSSCTWIWCVCMHRWRGTCLHSRRLLKYLWKRASCQSRQEYKN